MLRLTLTLIPRGDERQVRELGRAEIENDGTGTETIGNYHVAMRGILHRDVDVCGFHRADGPWALALSALRSLLS